MQKLFNTKICSTRKICDLQYDDTLYHCTGQKLLVKTYIYDEKYSMLKENEDHSLGVWGVVFLLGSQVDLT